MESFTWLPRWRSPGRFTRIMVIRAADALFDARCCTLDAWRTEQSSITGKPFMQAATHLPLLVFGVWERSRE